MMVTIDKIKEYDRNPLGDALLLQEMDDYRSVCKLADDLM
jgi:hypothetical protein